MRNNFTETLSDVSRGIYIVISPSTSDSKFIIAIIVVLLFHNTNL